MNVLLVDVDSTIANLALMQASAWHKARGDRVALARGEAYVPTDAPFRAPDLAYVSCVFTWNAPRARAIARRIRSSGADVLLGGTGVDLSTKLPDGIDGTAPDYELYPPYAAAGESFDYALGFCLRGCNRRCQFCVVPLKEGRIDPSRFRHPSQWVPARFKKAMLLDNDVALYPDGVHDAILGWFLESGVRVCISQGYDIRCVTPQRAALLAELKPQDTKFSRTRLYVAWDYMGVEGWVRRGLRMLLDAGFGPRQIMVYMVTGFNTTRDGDWYRFQVLTQEFGVMPYVMKYNDRKDDRWLNAFDRWVNTGCYRFKSPSVPFEEFDGNPDPSWRYDPARPRQRDHDPVMAEFHAAAQGGPP